MKRSASAVWKGGLKDGKGSISTESGVLANAPYGFQARFEGGKGTNPEELLGAAHAGCFTMALTALLARQQLAPTRIHTTARVHLEQSAGGFSIPRIELQTRATIPGLDAEKFAALAADAKQNCPVSKALAGVEISLDAKLA